MPFFDDRSDYDDTSVEEKDKTKKSILKNPFVWLIITLVISSIYAPFGRILEDGFIIFMDAVDSFFKSFVNTIDPTPEPTSSLHFDEIEIDTVGALDNGIIRPSGLNGKTIIYADIKNAGDHSFKAFLEQQGGEDNWYPVEVDYGDENKSVWSGTYLKLFTYDFGPYNYLNFPILTKPSEP